jgi:hypothetical protein
MIGRTCTIGWGSACRAPCPKPSSVPCALASKAACAIRRLGAHGPPSCRLALSRRQRDRSSLSPISRCRKRCACFSQLAVSWGPQSRWGGIAISRVSRFPPGRSRGRTVESCGGARCRVVSHSACCTSRGMRGAFASGRTRLRKSPHGGAAYTKRPREAWHALVPDAHPGYISWDECEANQERLQGNCTRRSRPGAAREGNALLQGSVLCGHCGKNMATS